MKRRMIAMLLALATVLMLLPVSALAADTTESTGQAAAQYEESGAAAQTTADQGYWRSVGGKWYFYDTDTKTYNADGLWKISGNWYCFNASGVMQTGWYQDSDGKWYYAASNGVCKTGWQKINGNWYWFNNGTDSNGYDDPYMATGLWTINGSFWIFRSNGPLVTKAGWFEDVENTYDDNGNPTTYKMGWVYCDANGKCRTGWQKIDGKWWYFGAKAAISDLDTDWPLMLSGWQKIDGKIYYLKNYMKTGWQKIDGSWYYFNNDMKTGWQKISNKWYYFGADGVMVSSCTLSISGKSYTFDSHGVWVG